MKPKYLKILLLLILVCIPLTQTGYCQDIYEKNYTKADLPTGGQFVPNPKLKSEIYYFTNWELMRPDKSNVQKFPGLYHSIDSGKTWSLLCEYFQFKGLFIHPVSGDLFAIIKYTSFIEDKGYFVPAYADKAITSHDGKHWKDIMGKQVYLLDISNIFQDPDHPDRVCLVGNVLRSYILQSKDAGYSDWEFIATWSWQETHPNTSEDKKK